MAVKFSLLEVNVQVRDPSGKVIGEMALAFYPGIRCEKNDDCGYLLYRLFLNSQSRKDKKAGKPAKVLCDKHLWA